MRNVRLVMFIKLIVLIGALILAWCLLFLDITSTPAEQSTVIVLDIGSGMMTQDVVTSKWDYITRFSAAKKMLTKIVQAYPERSFGLITYGAEIEYLLPPTLDSGTLLQYINSLLASQYAKDAEWSPWLLAALQDKDMLIVGDVTLPKSLTNHSQTLPLAEYQHFSPALRDSLASFGRISTTQTQWLIIVLCLLAVLSL